MKKTFTLFVLVFILSVFAGRMVAFSQVAPTITSFTPSTGAVGTSITISGSNFNPSKANNSVFFGSVKATVITASTTELTVQVPTGATYQPISVLDITTGLTNSSTKTFIPTFAPFTGKTFTKNSFAPKVFLNTGWIPGPAVLADIDDDGRLDLVVVNTSSSSISIYKNVISNGQIDNSSFATKVEFATDLDPRLIVIRDLDGDGKLDITTVNGANRTISILRNTSTVGSITSTSFAPKVDITTDGILAIAIDDLDGDGKPDLAAAGNYTVSIYKNISIRGSITSSSFASKVDYSAYEPNAIAIGDLDEDGKKDLAVSCRGVVSIYRNTSTVGSITSSSFAPKIDFRASEPKSIAIGDIDGDNKPDLVTSNYHFHSVSVFKNTAPKGRIDDNSFAPKIDFFSGRIPNGVAIGDLDGDGKADLAVSHYNYSKITVLKNMSTNNSISSSSFATGVHLATNPISFEDSYTPPTFNMAIGDLNTDGKPDLVSVGYGNKISVLQNNLEFTPPATPLGFTATAGKGYNTLRWQRNSETDLGYYLLYGGTTSNPTALLDTIKLSDSTYYHTNLTAGTAYFYRISAVDIEANESILTADVTASPTLLPSSPIINSFTPSTGAVGTTVTISGSNFNPFLLNNIVFFGATKATVTAASTTELTVQVPAGATYQSISVLNMTTGLANSSTRAFNPTFAPFTGGPFTNKSFANKTGISNNNYQYQTSVAIGDIDGDGKPDLAVATINSNKIAVYRNTSTNGSLNSISFTDKIDFATGDQPYSLVIRDLDGDSKPDLIAVNRISNTVSILKNTSIQGSITSSSFAAKVDFATARTPYFVAVDDLDSDGRPDIVVANSGNNSISILKNISALHDITSTSFAPKVDFITGDYPSSVAIGDLDGDDKPDIVVGNHTNNSISILRNLSVNNKITGTSFAPKVDFSTGGYPNSVAIGDLDGDGKPDLATSNWADKTISILRNTAVSGNITNSSFTEKLDFVTSYTPRLIAFSDLDGDNKLDIVVPISYGNSVLAFKNTAKSGSISSNSFADKFNLITNDTPHFVAINDLDGDSKPDIVVANDNSLSAYQNNFDFIAPAAPLGLTATAGLEKNTISWNSNTDPDLGGYLIYGGSSPNPTKLLDTLTESTLSYIHTGLSPETEYFYRISAFDKQSNESAITADVSATPIFPPAAITTSVDSLDFGQVSVSSNNNIKTYQVTGKYLRNDILVIVSNHYDLSLDGNTWATNITLPKANAPYQLFVRFNAIKNDGLIYTGNIYHITKGDSITISVKSKNLFQVAQNITFSTVTKQVFTRKGFKLQASASSGLPVRFNILSGPAILLGDSIAFRGTGEVTVTASQAGDNNYFAAPKVTQSFFIDKAPQNIFFSALVDKVYSANPITLSAKASSGLPIYYSVNGPASVIGNVLRITGVGTVEVKASQPGNSNYLPALEVVQKFTIGKGSQVISFQPIPDKTFRDGPIIVSGRASSGLPISMKIVSGPATLKDSLLTLTGIGLVTVRGLQAGNSLYEAAPDVDITFEVKTNAIYSIAGKVFAPGNLPMLDAEVVLQKKDPVTGKFAPFKTVTLTTAGNTNNFFFGELEKTEYVIILKPGSKKYSNLYDTYYGNVVLWENATALKLEASRTGLDIIAVEKPAPSSVASPGATISGILVEEPTSGSGNRIRVVARLKATGDPIPGTPVMLINKETNQVVATDKTNLNGEFNLSNIQPGSYRLSFEFNGIPMAMESAGLEIASPDQKLELTATVGSSTITVIQETVTGIKKDLEYSYQIYPNPAADIVYLNLGKPCEGKLQVIVSDLNGREIIKTKTFTYQQVKGKLELNVKFLPPSIYLVRLIDINTGTLLGEVKKLVITK